MMLKKFAFAAITSVCVGAAMAQAPAPLPKPGTDGRQATQEERINQGLQSGRLTTAEAARLQKGESRIDAAQNRAAADGTVTHNEQRHLQKMTRHENQAIYKQKHDRQNDRNHDGKRDHRQGQHNKS